MREFFYPSSIAVFGVADNTRNLAKNIISNCLEMGFQGAIYPVGREPGGGIWKGDHNESRVLARGNRAGCDPGSGPVCG